MISPKYNTDNPLTTKEDIYKFKHDIIKWMFVFWIAQIVGMVAIVKLLM